MFTPVGCRLIFGARVVRVRCFPGTAVCCFCCGVHALTNWWFIIDWLMSFLPLFFRQVACEGQIQYIVLYHRTLLCSAVNSGVLLMGFCWPCCTSVKSDFMGSDAVGQQQLMLPVLQKNPAFFLDPATRSNRRTNFYALWFKWHISMQGGAFGDLDDGRHHLGKYPQHPMWRSNPVHCPVPPNVAFFGCKQWRVIDRSSLTLLYFCQVRFHVKRCFVAQQCMLLLLL